MSDLEKNAQQSDSKKKLKIAIIIVLAIFIISCVALVARIIYVHSVAQPGDTIVYVPHELIDEEQKVASDGVPLLRISNMLKAGSSPIGSVILLSSGSSNVPAKVIELYSGQSADNDRFDVQNMLPGDTYTKYYCLKVYHSGAITAYFNIKNVLPTKALDTILNIKVTRLDDASPVVLCDGTFAAMKDNDMPISIAASAKKETEIFFKIEVSLPTSAGNEFQGATLTADFNWLAANPEETTTRPTTTRPKPPVTTTVPVETTTPEPPETTTPEPPETTTPTPPETTTTPTPPDTTTPPPDGTTTDDGSGHLIPKKVYLIWPWMIVPIISLAVLIILLVKYNKKEEEEDVTNV